ncbi:ABC transporter ATP-binding protein [Flagellimonas sp. S174]|uniref:ABC transporter ATP-binding protein n=1 Tax=Flagellimonas sp. S174 TaxID=3410790 RepID=UPI003BF462C5
MLNVQIRSFDYDGRLILKDIFFKINKGEHLALMGESGSGKSTLLKLIYGLVHVEEGSIFWGEKQALGPNYNLVPGEPYMKFLSQDFDLMPFTSVEENIAEHLSVFTQESHAERVKELLDLIELEAFAKTKVKNLSGGQKQRVALAKALAQEPELLLLDEPFSNIDHFKKNELRVRLFPYLKRKGISVLTATHDSNDVLSFADEIMVLKNGKIEDHQKTEYLYKNPKNYYVASLFGTINELPVSLLKDYSGLDTSLLVYPHEFEISNKSGLEVTVSNNFFKGTHYIIEGISEDGYSVFFTNKSALRSETKVFLNVSLQLINQRIHLSGNPHSSKS